MKYTLILSVLCLLWACQPKDTPAKGESQSCVADFKARNESIRQDLKELMAQRNDMKYGELKQALGDLLKREGEVLKSLKGCNFNGDLSAVRNAMQEVLKIQQEIQQALNQVEQLAP